MLSSWLDERVVLSLAFLSELERLRDLLWDSLEDSPADKRGTLAREYRSTLEKIQELKKKKQNEAGDPIDELANRRATRSANASKGQGGSSRAGS